MRRTLSMAASTGSSSRLIIVSENVINCCLKRSSPVSDRSAPARHDRKLRNVRRSASYQCRAATNTLLDDWPRRTIVIWSSVSKLEKPAAAFQHIIVSISDRQRPTLCCTKTQQTAKTYQASSVFQLWHCVIKTLLSTAGIAVRALISYGRLYTSTVYFLLDYFWRAMSCRLDMSYYWCVLTSVTICPQSRALLVNTI